MNVFQRMGNEPHKNSGTGFLGEFSKGLVVYRTLKYSIKRKDTLMHLPPTNELLLVLNVSYILLGSTINNSTHLLSTLKGYHVWVGSRMRKSFAVYPGCHVRCSSTWSVQSSISSGICCDCVMSGCCVEHFSSFISDESESESLPVMSDFATV